MAGGGYRLWTRSLASSEAVIFVIDVELKPTGFRGCVALVEAVLACVSRHRVAGHVLLSSFDPIALARVRQRDRAIATGFLFHGRQLAPFRLAWPATVLRPFAVHPERALVTPANVSAWRKRGYAINPWTIDDAATQRRLAALGVDSITTNDPAACLANLAAAPTTPTPAR